MTINITKPEAPIAIIAVPCKCIAKQIADWLALDADSVETTVAEGGYTMSNGDLALDDVIIFPATKVHDVIARWYGAFDGQESWLMVEPTSAATLMYFNWDETLPASSGASLNLGYMAPCTKEEAENASGWTRIEGQYYTAMTPEEA